MKIGKNIINLLIKDKDVISATIVGSYSEGKNIREIGDLDIVVICKQLNKKIFQRLNNIINRSKYRNDLLINSTFGPLKIGSKSKLPLHLMIYDVKQHKEHVIKSPFTCYDWERSKIFKGIPLKKLFPVKGLQLNDFYKARRSSQEYLEDINKNRISVRKYKFQGKKIIEKKLYVKIDPRNRGEFVYHVINFLVVNLYKFYSHKNIKVTGSNFNSFFLKITNNDIKLLEKFKILRKHKIKKSFEYDLNITLLAVKFIKKYNKYLNKLKKEYLELNFLRHAKTKMNKKNTFMGITNNPRILNFNIKKINKIKYDFVIVSELQRSQLTAKLFNYKKIIKNHLINEIDYGEADGMSFKKFKKKYPNIIKSWNNKIDIRFPNGENTNDVKVRVEEFFKYLKRFKKNSKILIISHSFFLRTLISVILNINIKLAYKINIDHLNIYQFLKKRDKILPNFRRSDLDKIYTQTND